MMRQTLTLMALLAGFAAGCAAENPDTPLRPAAPDMAGADMIVLDQLPAEAPVVRVIGTAATSAGTSVPVHGTGPANGTVFIQGESGTASAQIGSSGAFCVDVALIANKVNSLVARAVNEAGVYSEPANFSVTQTGVQNNPSQGVPRDSYNAAQDAQVVLEANDSIYGTLGGVAVFSSLTLHDGTLADMVDADPTGATHARIRYDSSGSSDAYIWFSFTTPNERVNRVRILTGPTCTIRRYAVWVSNNPSPGDPSATNSHWSRLPMIVQGMGTDEVTFATKEVTHLALLLEQEPGDLPDGCEDGFWSGYNNYYDIRSVEAWTEAFSPPPRPAALTCASGG